MEVIKRAIKENLYFPSEVKDLVHNKKIAFLDIETTGFSRIKNKIILIGLLYQEGDSIVIEQYFAEDPSEEIKILTAFKNAISAFDLIITYNGDTFDIPFLNSKYEIYNIDFSIKKKNSLDLIKMVRSNKNILKLENCKLKTVERKLGINRKDEITGGESVKIYKQFVKTKSKSFKDIVLQHNYDDIYYLPKIMSIYDLIKDINILDFDISIRDEAVKLKVDLSSLFIEGETISVQGNSASLSIPDQIYYSESYSFEWNPQIGDFYLKLQSHQGHLSNNSECIYIDKKDFDFKIDFIDKTIYSVPNNILIIKENKKLIYNNINCLLKDVITQIISNFNMVPI